MATTHDSTDQLSELIRSIEARISSHHQERQALIRQLQEIRRTSDRLLLALGSADAPRGRGRPRATSAAASALRRTGYSLSPATRKQMAEAAKKRWSRERRLHQSGSA